MENENKALYWSNRIIGYVEWWLVLIPTVVSIVLIYFILTTGFENISKYIEMSGYPTVNAVYYETYDCHAFVTNGGYVASYNPDNACSQNPGLAELVKQIDVDNYDGAMFDKATYSNWLINGAVLALGFTLIISFLMLPFGMSVNKFAVTYAIMLCTIMFLCTEIKRDYKIPTMVFHKITPESMYVVEETKDIVIGLHIGEPYYNKETKKKEPRYFCGWNAMQMILFANTCRSKIKDLHADEYYYEIKEIYDKAG